MTPMGEKYDDLLAIDAWLQRRSQQQRASDLVSDALDKREDSIREAIKYLAAKRGIEPGELWRQILQDEAASPYEGELFPDVRWLQ